MPIEANRPASWGRGTARRVLTRCLLYLLSGLLLLSAAPAAAEHYVTYPWTDADLALIYPEGWDAPVATTDADQLTLTLNGGSTTITLTVLPASTGDNALRPALEAQLASLNLLPLRYAVDSLYGRSGLHIEAVSRDRQWIGVGRSGRLPDSRALIVAARAPQADRASFTDDLNAVLGSIVFKADALPVRPTYHEVWSTPLGDQSTAGLAVSNDRLYVLDSDGVHVVNAQTGDTIAQYPFDHPAQPTALAVDGAGIAYVGDSVCRCVRRMNPDGRWLETVGSFGGGAPYNLAVAQDGTIYATDKTDSGYLLRVLGEPRNRTVRLSFNGSAPPLVALDGSAQVWVMEWLSSLIDGDISGAVSLVSGDKPAADLRFWLETLAPDKVTAMTTDPDGDLVLATTDQGVLVVDSSGDVIDQFMQDVPLVRLAFGADGILYATRADGTLTALSTHGTQDRFGRTALTLDVPVQGTLTEATLQQLWTYEGTAGEHVTISAVDLSRTDPYAVGLDVALRLLAPDRTELAYNDDQDGADLFGVYDAQIANVTLPETGTYTVSVEWRQGQGMYTLGISADQPIVLGSDGVAKVSGRLQDVFPTQRWAIDGHRGDVLTLTMTAQSDTLDPALGLLKPDGSLLAYNDDAKDPELKDDAQLTQVRLPADGTYVIEATRYSGVGTYNLVVVSTSQNR